MKGLPPLAFEIAREVRELGGWVEGAWRGGDEGSYPSEGREDFA